MLLRGYGTPQDALPLEDVKDHKMKMPLRPDLKPEMVTRYLETIESLFQNMIVSYQGGHPAQDFHAMLETAGELLNMVLFGILRHADPA